jgi:hypothetical protein
MIRLALVGVGLAVLAPPVAAAPGGGGPSPAPSDTREAVLFVITPATTGTLGWTWRADAAGAALTTLAGGAATSGAAATASVEVGLAEPGCDLVAAGGQIDTRSDDVALSAQQWGSLCLLGSDDGASISLDHRLEWDVTPRLLSAPRLRPGRQRHETVGIDVVGSTEPLHPAPPNGPPPSPADSQQDGTARLEVATAWGGDDPSDVALTFDAVLRTFRHAYDAGPTRDVSVWAQRLDVMFHDNPAEPGTVVALALDPVRISGLRWQGVRLGARLGGQVVLGPPAARTVGAAGDAMDPSHLLVAEAGASIEGDLARGMMVRLAGDRRSRPVWDGRLAIDNRLTASWTVTRRHLRAHVDATAALTRLVAARDRHVDVGTGGVVAEAELDVDPQVTLKARAESGRAAYAVGATLDAPRWATEGLVMLAVHAGDR